MLPLMQIPVQSMVNFETYQQLALAFPDTVQLPHFDLISFRVKKKIFATYWPKQKRAMLKLPLVQQSVFCDFNPGVFSPVPNAWGKKGATFVELNKVTKTVFKEALEIAYYSALGRPIQ